MIQELLVLLACSQNAGCSDTTSQYFEANPKARQIVYEHRDKMKRVLPPSIVSITPVALFLVRQKGNFYVTRNISLQLLEQDRLFVVFKKSF